MDGFSNLMQLGSLTGRGGPIPGQGMMPPSHGGPMMPPGSMQGTATHMPMQQYGGGGYTGPGLPPVFGTPISYGGGFPIARGGPQIPFGGFPIGQGGPSTPYGGMQNLNMLQRLYGGGY